MYAIRSYYGVSRIFFDKGAFWFAARIAAASGSGFMTIPHPPPYGLSSVTRCFPSAKFLISMADTRILFRSIALLIIPCSQKGLNISGKIVRTTKFILFAFTILRANSRITSYNVCYTKLLRGRKIALPEADQSGFQFSFAL